MSHCHLKRYRSHVAMPNNAMYQSIMSCPDHAGRSLNSWISEAENEHNLIQVQPYRPKSLIIHCFIVSLTCS